MTDPIQELDLDSETHRAPVADFSRDNFSSRRTTGHNLFDPDSLITGEESAAGLTYSNSSRVFPSAEIREQAIRGEISQADIIRLYPRQFNQQAAD